MPNSVALQFEFSAGPREVLNPTKAVALMERTMDTVGFLCGYFKGLWMREALKVALIRSLPRRTAPQVSEEIEETGDRPLIFHGFSMSGFMFGNALNSMDAQPERFQPFRSSLKAQVGSHGTHRPSGPRNATLAQSALPGGPAAKCFGGPASR